MYLNSGKRKFDRKCFHQIKKIVPNFILNVGKFELFDLLFFFKNNLYSLSDIIYIFKLYSMRILPHHQDTGGFFVAVLEKVKPLPWENGSSVFNQNIENTNTDNKKDELSLEEEAEHEEVENNAGDKKRSLESERKWQEPQRKRKRVIGYREDPFVFFKDDKEDVWLSIK